MLSFKQKIGLLFLIVQLGFIINARFSEARYFCWAPYDYQIEYLLRVRVKDQMLTEGEIRNRYRVQARGLEVRSIQHLKNILTQYERTYGKNEQARIDMHYTTNGRELTYWQWPQR